MTALGQTRRFRDVRDMSGLHPTADISGPGWHFAFVPTRDLAQVDNAVGSLRRPLFSLLAPGYAQQRPRIRIDTMTRWISALSLLSFVLFWTNQGRADPLEYIGKPVRGIPVSSAVKVGKSIFVSGMPAFDANGKLAVGDFPAQMKQVMDNLTGILKAAGADWSRVVKTNVLLMRASDFAEMNRIYGSYFPDGKYPARTTVIVAGLPHPDFLLEIECEALLE
jgi:2-iminobutanoate/2-iminopropanoate deaminase